MKDTLNSKELKEILGEIQSKFNMKTETVEITLEEFEKMKKYFEKQLLDFIEIIKRDILPDVKYKNEKELEMLLEEIDKFTRKYLK